MLYKDGRIAGVQSTLDTDLVPYRATEPWAVTGLPTVGVSNEAAFTTGFYFIGLANTALGASTALTTVVDITGSGYIDFAALARGNSTTSATLRLKLTVDGVEVKDYTTGALTTAYRGLVLIGESSGGGAFSRGIPLYFRSSLKVEAQQSANVSSIAYMRYVLAEPYVT